MTKLCIFHSSVSQPFDTLGKTLSWIKLEAHFTIHSKRSMYFPPINPQTMERYPSWNCSLLQLVPTLDDPSFPLRHQSRLSNGAVLSEHCCYCWESPMPDGCTASNEENSNMLGITLPFPRMLTLTVLYTSPERSDLLFVVVFNLTSSQYFCTKELTIHTKLVRSGLPPPIPLSKGGAKSGECIQHSLIFQGMFQFLS